MWRNKLIYYWWKNADAAAAYSLQSCLTLCDPIDGSPPGSSVHGILQASGLPCPPPMDLPNPGIKLGSPALQADSSLLSYQGSPDGSINS